MRTPPALVAILLLACTSPSEPDDKTSDTAPDTAPIPSDVDADGYTVEAGDCDDADDRIHPGGTEECATAADDDCDGDTNDSDALGCQPFFVDADGDGHGGEGTACVCVEAPGYSALGDDCDDGDAAIAPGREEVCRDQVDNNCDEGVPECVLADLSLADADARYTGEESSDRAGLSVEGVADVDGDGFDDFLIGAVTHGETQSTQGAVYLVLGSASPTSGSLDDADARFDGDGESARAGDGLAGLGDVDGDGLGDFLIGSPHRDEYTGAAHLVLGSPSMGSRSLADADATFLGAGRYDNGGAAVAAAGDVDGDGLADMLVGAWAADDGGAGAGAAYLILGASTVASATLGTVGATYGGVAAVDTAGAAVAGAGDVDGDGHPDLLVGAPLSDALAEDAGVVYLVLGSASPGSLGLEAADAVFEGAYSRGEAGAALAGVGDSNADGYADFLVGAPEYSMGGRAYLVHGSASPASVPLAASAAVFSTPYTSGDAGWSVAGAGDTDGDGHDDLLVGDTGYWSRDEGAAWLVSGAAAVGALTLGTGDTSLTGEHVGDGAGSVSGGEDFNGDGYPDLFVGAYANDAGANLSGAAYVVLGTGF
ncbi:MAG: integrin alpha [Myxococcota bacterium]